MRDAQFGVYPFRFKVYCPVVFIAYMGKVVLKGKLSVFFARCVYDDVDKEAVFFLFVRRVIAQCKHFTCIQTR